MAKKWAKEQQEEVTKIKEKKINWPNTLGPGMV